MPSKKMTSLEATFFMIAIISTGYLAYVANQYVNGVDAVTRFSASLLQVESIESKEEVTLKLRISVSNSNPVAAIKVDLIGFSIFAEGSNLGSKQEPFRDLLVGPMSKVDLDLDYTLKGESAERYHRTFPSKPQHWTVRARFYLSDPFETSVTHELTTSKR